MKRLILLISIALISMNAMAQDVIFRSSTDSIVAKVLSIGTKEITYRKWSNLEGPIYSIYIQDVVAIRYANGSYDFFNNKTEPVIENTNTSISLIRSGNTYLYGDLVMNNNSLEDWLEEQNCPAAYHQFKAGRITANAGWAFMIVGLMMDLSGTIIAVKAPRTNAGYILVGIGGAFELACIPTLIVGYSKMHSSADIYNVSCSKTTAIRPYWAVQASSNGIGLAYHF